MESVRSVWVLRSIAHSVHVKSICHENYSSTATEVVVQMETYSPMIINDPCYHCSFVSSRDVDNC